MTDDFSNARKSGGIIQKGNIQKDKGETPQNQPLPSVLEVIDWLSAQGVIPLPCEPRTKKVMPFISRGAFGNREGDVFLNPSEERIERVSRYWGQRNMLKQMGTMELSISLAPAPGFNSGRRLFCVDFDDDGLLSDAISQFADCPAVRGKKGCKIIGVLDASAPPASLLQYYRDGDTHPKIEIFTEKKHFLIYGEHPDFTPSKPIFYRFLQGFGMPLPTLSWGDIRTRVDKIAKKHGLTARGEEKRPAGAEETTPPPWDAIREGVSKEYAEYAGMNAGGSISDRLHLNVTDYLMPDDAVYTGDGLQGGHPIHGSTTGKNLSVNTTLNVWYCHRHQTGGGPLEAYAVRRGIISCEDARPGCLKGKWGEVFRSLEQDGYRIGSWGKETMPKTPQETPQEPQEGSKENTLTVSAVSESADVGVFIDNGKLNYSLIADYIFDRLNVVVHNGVTRVYQNGIYIEGMSLVNHEIKTILDKLKYNKKVGEDTRTIWYHILNKEVHLTYPFDTYPNAIPVQNGVIVIDYEKGTWHLEDHSPKFRFTFKLPVFYDVSADPSHLEEVFRQWVNDEDVSLLYQLPAQALLQIQGREFKKAYLIVGGKNTGKTTYAVHLLTAFFGSDFIARVPLQELVSDRFALADLEGKILNVYDDLSALKLDDVGQFKALTGSQFHDILKKRQHRYRGRIYAVHLFTCNSFPILKDTLHGDAAFFERWEIISFTNTFPPKDEFRESLLTKTSLSALLNRVLEEMVKIRRDNLFRKSTADDIKEIWLAGSDPYRLLEFIQLNFDPDPDQVERVQKDEITAAFHKFAKERNLPLLDKHKLCTRLYYRGFHQRHLISSSGDQKTGAVPGSRRERILVGYKWKDNAPHRVRFEGGQTSLEEQTSLEGLDT